MTLREWTESNIGADATVRWALAFSIKYFMEGLLAALLGVITVGPILVLLQLRGFSLPFDVGGPFGFWMGLSGLVFIYVTKCTYTDEGY